LLKKEQKKEIREKREEQGEISTIKLYFVWDELDFSKKKKRTKIQS